ncbi:MAG: transcription factor S [Euryarchaeota archaeon]|nr:transcription factor S [Euryarchaeota archaeon]
MPFCPQCKSLVYPDRKTRKLECKKCEVEVAASGPQVVTQKASGKETLILDENSRTIETRSLTDTECPKCGHGKAYADFRQTRRSDEPPTMFAECVECGHRWRQY